MIRLLKNNKIATSFICVLFISSHSFAQKIPRATGYVPTPPEELAKYSSPPAYRGPLLPAFDLSKRFPPPGNQGRQSSCVAWAIAYAAGSYYVRNAPPDQQEKSFLGSPAFLYNQLTSDRKGCGAGTNIAQALNIFKSQGLPSLNAFRYDEYQCSSMPDELVRADAFKHRIKGFQYIGDRKPDSFKSQIQRGNPVVFGMNVSNTFSYWYSKSVFKEGSISGDSGHAMVIVGYDDSKQAFRVLNSWGRQWGDSGFVWIDYQTLMSHLQDAFVIDPGFLISVDDLIEPIVKPVIPEVIPVKPDNVVTDIIVPPPKPVIITVDKLAIQMAINRLTSRLSCARVIPTVKDGGLVQISGYVNSQAELTELKNSIQKIEGVSKIESTLYTAPWPVCEINSTIDQFKLNTNGLKTYIPKHSDGKLKGGERFNIVGTTSKGGYLYLTYLQTEGPANDLVFGEQIQPNTLFEIGTEPIAKKENNYVFGKMSLKVSPPYGAEVIVAILSPKPLFNEDSKGINDREFLTKLRAALYKLPAQDRANIAISTFRVQTSER